MIAKLIARLLCWRYGHKRGKRVAPQDVRNPVAVNAPTNVFACPRCGDQWARKAKAA